MESLNFSSLFNFLSDHSWLVLILTTFGGLVVLVGLILEYGDKEEYSSARDLRRSRGKKKWGEILVIVGVGLETFVAFTLAGKDIWENRQTVKNIAQIDARDPLNLPLYSLTADADFCVKLTASPPPETFDCFAVMVVFRPPPAVPFRFDLTSRHATRGSGLGFGLRWFHMTFDLNGPQIEKIPIPNRPTAEVLAEALDSLEIIFQGGLTNDVERGSVNLFANNRLVRRFDILPLGMSGGNFHLTNSASILLISK
jgi:hypothetical protein